MIDYVDWPGRNDICLGMITSISRSILALATVGLLEACASPPANTDYGSYPDENYKPSAEADIKALLKDGDSAKFEYGLPEKVYVNNGLLRGGDVVFTGYAVPVGVNAKNSFGGYTGYQPWTCFVTSDVVQGCTAGDASSSPLVHKVE